VTDVETTGEQGGEGSVSACHRGIFTIAGEIPSQLQWRDMTYEPLRGNVWTISEGINRSIFVEGDTGIVAFDTFGSPMGAIAYRAAIARVFPDKPVHTVVYTHDHLDHTGYAADFAPEARIIAHELTQNVLVARRSDGQLPATETWTGESAWYEIDGVRFQLTYPGPTHGDGNAAAWFPDLKLLFMVDSIIPGVGYTFLPDWHLAPYIPTVSRLLELEWDLFVPGHFWTTDRRGFAENIEWYEAVAETAQRALAEGVDVDSFGEITRYAHETLARDYGRLFRFDEYAAMNLLRYVYEYLHGGWGIEGNTRACTTPLEQHRAD
jgi:glyoxylase-like metal-dependent hydrolase (beta-lactamase superfamily II)